MTDSTCNGTDSCSCGAPGCASDSASDTGTAERLAPQTLVITASVSTSTCVGMPGARDVEVIVQIPGLDPIEGEVTLAPRQCDGKLAAYGPRPDHWVSGDLLRRLNDLCDRDFRATLDAIEAAAVAACEEG